jgi:NADH-quinone oxidoreductase subunit J
MFVALFWIFSIVAVIFALLVVIQRKAIYSALSLIVVLCSFAGLYAIMGATFVAAIQVVVYAGAIMVLFVFIIWFLGLRTGEEPKGEGKWVYIPAGLGVLMGGAVIYIVVRYWKGLMLERQTDIKEIAKVMMGKYVLPFELTSILFLVALIGAFYLAKGKKKEIVVEKKEEVRDKLEKVKKKKGGFKKEG